MKITQGHGADVVYDPVGMIVPFSSEPAVAMTLAPMAFAI
jgi:hypothetical protein